MEPYDYEKRQLTRIFENINLVRLYLNMENDVSNLMSSKDKGVRDATREFEKQLRVANDELKELEIKAHMIELSIKRGEDAEIEKRGEERW